MTAQNPLEHYGTFSDYPLAELLVEIGQAKLDGSVRLSNGELRSIFYFRDGSVAYAVSNAREHRLINFLIETHVLDRAGLAGLPKCTNDVELAAALVQTGTLTAGQVNEAVVGQIEKIVIDVMQWPAGEWHFSPLVRSRDDLNYPVNIHKVLINYARCQPMSAVTARFKSMAESFLRTELPAEEVYLQAHEDYVLNRFGEEPKKIQDLTLECGLPENGFLHALYVLWLGGLLERMSWNSAFSENRLCAIRNAQIARVKQAKAVSIDQDAPASVPDGKAERIIKDEPAVPQAPAVPDITPEEYLARVEGAATFYDILGIDSKAGVPEIKAAYILLAKLFHPDRFHRAEEDLQARIQLAFAKVQSAYDTLRSAEARENYDFRVRKELETRAKLKAQGVNVDDGVDVKKEQGLENFEVGLSLLMDGDHEGATPFLARAAHYNQDNALYRAYYGKALSYDENKRHKAEGEMQAAVKLDPANPKIRLMLVEFLMENNLLKRAEGELNRFLQIAPDHAEARRLLEKLKA
ncbi:MAG: DnaJ domain-containing protein [Chloracidobacterium sp.]|nr:DnaJ domain-containing protein [Chloracidobacterium sp.]